jgi:hypothetical protein
MVGNFPHSKLGKRLKNLGAFDKGFFEQGGIDIINFGELMGAYSKAIKIFEENGYSVKGCSEGSNSGQLSVTYSNLDSYLQLLEQTGLDRYSDISRNIINSRNKKSSAKAK